MKLSLVFNPFDKKLQRNSYSQTYRDMFVALVNRFDEVQYVTGPCELTGDVVIIYDVHSSHHVEIEKHPLVYSYMNDPHQVGMTGTYTDGSKVTKLDARTRMGRATDRGVKYIICPYRNGFNKYLREHGEQELVWFPVAPRQRTKPKKLKNRRQEILANGHLWQGTDSFKPYAFRAWAYKQPNITHISHNVYKSDTPIAGEYQEFLGSYAASLALCDTYVVPKYLEIPLCGCVSFVQDVGEVRELGFIDGVNCVMVNKENFAEKTKQYQNQEIADAGYKLVSENYTSKHFANYIHNHIEGQLNGNSR